jgi:hypothetical protein
VRHAQPYGLTVFALALATWAALILLAYALNRLRRPRRVRPSIPLPVPAHTQETEPYDYLLEMNESD